MLRLRRRTNKKKTMKEKRMTISSDHSRHGEERDPNEKEKHACLR